MNNFQILIVEDEILIADMIEEYLLVKGHQITGMAISYDEAVQSYLDKKPDLVLLDIRLSGSKTGIDVAQFIMSQSDPCPFIYLTSQIDSKSINEAKMTFPAGYLPKPIQKQSLYTTIEIAMYKHTVLQEAPATIQLFDGTKKVLVPLQDILFLRGEHVYLEVNMIKDQKILHRGTFKEILEQLPTDQFIQTHRSFVVNVSQISHWDHANIYIQNNTIPISRGRRKEVKGLLESK